METITIEKPRAKYFYSYGLGFLRFPHTKNLDAIIDEKIREVVNGCSCCSMCKAGSHCYIPPCVYA